MQWLPISMWYAIACLQEVHFGLSNTLRELDGGPEHLEMRVVWR